jgi:hypothetical protein
MKVVWSRGGLVAQYLRIGQARLCYNKKVIVAWRVAWAHVIGCLSTSPIFTRFQGGYKAAAGENGLEEKIQIQNGGRDGKLLSCV